MAWAGYELVEKTKYPYELKTHTMTVEELEISDLFDVHIVFKRKLEKWQFFCKAVRSFPSQPDFMEPELFDFIILQFKATKEDFSSQKGRKAGTSIEEKIIGRRRFLSILLALDLTTCTDKRIDMGWDPNGIDPITVNEEPLLQQFEAKQVLNYYQELDEIPDQRDKRIDVTRIGRISMKDAFRIVMGMLIAEATEYEPLVAVGATHCCNNATAMAKMQKKRRESAARLEAKAVGKLGRMRGPKQDMRMVVNKVATTFTSLKPVLDDVAFFEFVSVNGARIMRRNAAWEFVVQVAYILKSRLSESLCISTSKSEPVFDIFAIYVLICITSSIEASVNAYTSLSSVTQIIYM